MRDAIDRINKVAASEPQRAFAAIGEAVWWITIVNDTRRKRNGPSYALALNSCTPPIEDPLAGLKSVRNRIGHEVDLVDFIDPVASRPDPGDGRVTAWAWKSTPPPTRKGKRELDSHRSYEAALAGKNIVHGLQAAA